MVTYETVADYLVLQQHRGCCLGVDVVVVGYKVGVGDACLLLYHDGNLYNFSEASCAWVACFEDHGCRMKPRVEWWTEIERVTSNMSSL